MHKINTYNLEMLRTVGKALLAALPNEEEDPDEAVRRFEAHLFDYECRGGNLRELLTWGRSELLCAIAQMERIEYFKVPTLRGILNDEMLAWVLRSLLNRTRHDFFNKLSALISTDVSLSLMHVRAAHFYTWHADAPTPGRAKLLHDLGLLNLADNWSLSEYTASYAAPFIP